MLPLFAAKVSGQCVSVGPAMNAICQGGTSDPLGGTFGGDATGAIWTSSDPLGTFTNNGGSTPGTATYTASASGTITLTLTAIGGTCSILIVTKTIVVNANPTVNAGAALTAICQSGTTAALGGSFGGGATGAIWSDGSAGGTFTGNTTSGFATATYTASASSSSPVILTLTTSGGSCGTVFATKSLTVNPNPTANAGIAMADICMDGTTAALGGSVGGGATGGTWATTDLGTFTPSATDLNATWTPAAGWTGTTTLVLTTSGGSCGTTTASKQLTVNPAPVANNQTPSVCEDTYGSGSAAGINLTLLESSITGAAANRTVTWYSDAGHTTTVTTPTSRTITNGLMFYPRVTNTLSNCTNDATVTYTVNPKPVASAVQITGSPTQGATLTAGYTYTAGACNAEVLSKTEISWYVADDNAGTNSTWVATKAGTDKTYLLTAADAGKYLQICIRVSDGSVPLAPSSCSSGWFGPITPNAKPVASNVQVTGIPKVKNILTGTYVYTDAEGDPEGASVYQWITADDALGTNAQSVPGATSLTYQLTNAELGKYMGFRVRPIAVSGTITGNQASSTVWVGPVVNDPPVVSNITVTGTVKVADILSGHYTYSDNEGDLEGNSVYQWYTGTDASGTGSAVIGGATAQYYQLTNNEFGKYIGFKVTPVAQTGTTTGTPVTSVTWVGPVTNPPPVASSPSISGIKNVGEALTGQYVYSDAEGDLESGSLYEWLSSATLGGSYNAIPGETALTHVIKLNEQGMYFKFSVTPKTLTGSTTGTKVTTLAGFGPANTKPSATGVNITGTPVQVGTTLTATFTYSDPDGDAQGATQYRWFRDGDVVAGETSSTYLLTSADGGATMGVEITPVSATGFPNTGDPVTFTMSSTVSDPAGTKPVASNVCIDGKRMVDSVLTGRYTYTYASKPEGVSTFKWYRGSSVIPGETSINYTMKSIDLDSSIVFEVTPKSSNSTPKVGDPVRSNSLARITMTQTSFLSTDPDKVLTASPSGGYFWGTGVLNGSFSPKSVDYKTSPFPITYHINDHSCSQDAISVIYVHGVTTYISGVDTIYCQNGPQGTAIVKDILPGFPVRYLFLSDYNGFVSQPNDTTLTFDPSKLTPGYQNNYIYFYAASDIHFTSWYFLELPINIIGMPPITLNIADSSVFCSNDPMVDLFASPAGGVFTGPVTSGALDPSKAIGNAFIKYKYTNSVCKDSTRVPIIINAAPAVSFAAADSCISGSRDTTRFINTTTSADPIRKWNWEFSDQGVNIPDSVKSPGHLYSTGGFHRITLKATTINNCSATDIETIEMGYKPKADFRWENECKHVNDSIFLFDSTTSSTAITSRMWIFADKDTLLNVKNHGYLQPPVGRLKVEYIVRTSYRGCNDTITKTLYIRPTISLAKDDYFENFENGNGNWVKNYDTLNTWAFGTPSRSVINSAASGSNAWYTNFDKSVQKPEQSSIVSPCFNFDSIQRPMISIRLWTNFDKNRDGAALQYRIKDARIGDKEDWQYVGSYLDGINWFNSTLIQGRPGGDQIGWTAGSDLDKGWGEAKHKLDDLIGKKDVKFRVVYGSDGTAQENDGLAFDDVWIGRRSRGVLLEHFTNNSSADASAATAVVSDLSNRWTDDIINIQYHTNFPGADQYYNDNPGDEGSRILFYGLSRAPYTFIDGGADKLNFATLYDWVIASLDSNDVNRRSLVSPYFNISLHGSVAAGVLSVSGKFHALRAMDESNITLYLAVTEKQSTGAAGGMGETKYYNVFRKFLPDAGGISMKKVWALNESDTLTEKTWTITNIPGSANIEVIAFLQNNITKQVYQSESVLVNNITVGINDILAGSGKGFALYPNPASSKLSIAFDNPLTTDTEIKIFDYSGTLVKTYKAGSGGSEYTIDDLGLKSGIYLIRISSGGLDYGFKKLIVSEK